LRPCGADPSPFAVCHTFSEVSVTLFEQETLPQSAPATVTVFASPASWIESDALAPCYQAAALDGMLHVAGMPDLHPDFTEFAASPKRRP
jgi:hypothetical protein